MTPYTLTMSEAEAQQLRALVERTQSTHRPIILTNEETSEPMVVMVEIDAYEQAQRQQFRLYHLQLTHLSQWLDRVEQNWDDNALHNECILAWQNTMEPLWESCPEQMKDLCVALRLSVKQLQPPRFTREQIAALRCCLKLLRDTAPSEAEEEEAHQKLIEAGIPAMLAFDDDSLLNSYLAEL
ncbi:type II toxin-antitoxin system Phd/YefM family antitoxin [Chloroflexi bacterium TSY]|nr:type II toxin-antitoxin system Phd/YefM family antitoxin [Chloroflexi bacterium TSY]